MNTINAQEARKMTNMANTPLELVFNQIKNNSQEGFDYTYAMINEDSKAELIKLGYTITTSSQPNESRISW